MFCCARGIMFLPSYQFLNQQHFRELGKFLCLAAESYERKYTVVILKDYVWKKNVQICRRTHSIR